MADEASNEKVKSLLKTIGKIGLNAIYPNEFEHYFFALELVNGDGDTIEYFAFPILPEEISVTSVQLTTIKKTFDGVIAVKTPSFVPVDIDIKGTFGKSFKLLVGKGGKGVEAFGVNIGQGIKNIAKGGLKAGVKKTLSQTKDKYIDGAAQFSSFAKTGYGCVKILERIVDKSTQLDNLLYCYNPITGNNYIVEVVSFKHSQDKNSSNMMPSYSLKMKGVANLDSVNSDKSIWSSVKNISRAVLQNKANQVFNRARVRFPKPSVTRQPATGGNRISNNLRIR